MLFGATALGADFSTNTFVHNPAATLDLATCVTPMNIVAESDKATVNGNGCGGAQVGRSMYINSEASAARW